MANPPESEKPEPGEDASKERPEIKYPRRTERRKRTRANILKVAADHFSKTGYGATTMQAIADAADVHVTTLFMHFNTKSDLALNLVASTIDELSARASVARGKMAFPDFLRSEAQHFAAALKAQSHPGITLWKALRSDSELAFAWSEYETAQKNIFANYIAEDHGLERETDCRPDLVASLLGASLFLPHQRWVEGASRLNLADEVSKSVDLGLQGAHAILGAAGKPSE